MNFILGNIEILGKKCCCNRHKESVLREILAWQRVQENECKTLGSNARWLFEELLAALFNRLNVLTGAAKKCDISSASYPYH